MPRILLAPQILMLVRECRLQFWPENSISNLCFISQSLPSEALPDLLLTCRACQAQMWQLLQLQHRM